MRPAFIVLTLLASACQASGAASSLSDGPNPSEFVKLPDGFHIEVYARVPNARSMTWGDQGTLFVGNRAQDGVYAVVDGDSDGQADRVVQIAEPGRMPNGVAFRDGDLYVAQMSRIIRFDDIESHLDAPPKPVVVREDFPDIRHHGWKFIAFGPDGKLYVPVGAPCNICKREDPRFASIMRMDPNGENLEVYAHGIRNSVGFDWHPKTKTLWFTDNGRDHLGNDVPPDELAKADEAGLHFGYPYCHGGDIPDPEFGDERPCDAFVPPVQKLGPHVAALGMRFYTGTQFPPEYRDQIFIAEHGSWNRDQKIGYRVSLVRTNDDGTTTYETFASGWLRPDEEVLGRPVDVLVGPKGSLFVSDDYAGAIYRITYRQ